MYEDPMQAYLVKIGAPVDVRSAFSVARGLLEAGAMLSSNEEPLSRVHMGAGRYIHVPVATWNAHVSARVAAEKMLAKWQKDEAAKYWQARGIKVGAKVYAVARHMLNPLMTVRVEGVAKVGKRGPYVSSSGQRGQLSPDQFHAI